MKAFYARSYGGPEVMTFGDLPSPSPGSGEVLVAIHAASVNPVDWKVRRGDMRVITGERFPKILGCDFAGVVAALGPDVTGFRAGEQVYGAAGFPFRRSGSHAELVAVAAKRVRPVPDGIPLEVAAALPVAGLAALSGLRKCGDLAGRAVLVNGATGGVGHFAVQIARARGSTVTAVCSARNAELARALGASAVIDYAKEDFSLSGKTYDIVFDAHGSVGPTRASRALAPKGVYATTLPGPALVLGWPLLMLMGRRDIVAASMRAQPEDYANLEQLVLSGAVKPVIDRAFPLERAAEAFSVSEGGRARGKILITIG